MNPTEETKRLVIGEDAEGCRVTLELNIQKHAAEFTTTGEPIIKRTIDLQPITEYTTLTISGSGPGYGGQCQDTIRKELPDFRRLFVEHARILRILDIWDTYHMGDLKAGTRRQMAALKAWRAQCEAEGRGRDYGEACEYLKRIAAAPYSIEFEYLGQTCPACSGTGNGERLCISEPAACAPCDECNGTGYDTDDPNRGKWMPLPHHPNSFATKAEAEARAQQFQQDTGRATRILPIGNLLQDAETCPGTIYNYGSAWLVDPLPPEIEAEARGLFIQPAAPPVDAETGGLPGFIVRHGLKFDARRVDARPDGLMSDHDDQRHWRCTITAPARKLYTGKHGQPVADLARARPHRMSLYFSQGSAHTKAPKLLDVLNCLVQDAQGYDNAKGFAEWCSEYGYDEDSRTAHKVYKAVEREAKQLRRLLGDDVYTELLDQPTD